MRLIKYFRIATFSFLAFLITPAWAEVSLNYPSWDFIDNNRKLPGLPSDDASEYLLELGTWSRQADGYRKGQGAKYSLILSSSTISRFINTPLDIGYGTSDVFVDVDGESISLGLESYTTRQQMRDILLMQSLRSSVDTWHKEYIDSIRSGSGASPIDAYNQAFKIYSTYIDYLDKSNFNKKTNPLLNILLGTGSTSYFTNLFSSSGYLEEYVEGAFKKAIGNYASGASGSQFLNSLKVSKGSITDYGSDLGISLLEEAGVISSSTGLLSKNLYSLVSGVASKGLAQLMLPAKIYSSGLTYIAKSGKSYSQGAHLLNYYHFMDTYPDRNDMFLEASGKLMEFYDLQAGENSICQSGIIKDDAMATALCRHKYGGYIGAHGATDDEAATAYAVAQLFLIVRSLDFDFLKRELVSRVKLEELAEQGFYLENSYQNNNTYYIRIPDEVVVDAEHGQIIHATYKYGSLKLLSNTSQTDVIEAVDYVSTENKIPRGFRVNLSLSDSTKVSSKVEATIVYQDGFIRESSSKLTYYPQITELKLNNLPTPIPKANWLATISYCGDKVSTGRLEYKKIANSESEWAEQVAFLENETELENNCRQATITVDGEKIAYRNGYGNYQVRVSLADKVSSDTTTELPNPNDIDKDGLPDDWEEKYFGDISSNSGASNADDDDQTNYQEYLNGTDPTLAGALGITKEIILEKHEDNQGNTINTFNLTGIYWANIIVKEDAILDLEGRGLQIEGTLVVEGVSRLNGGSLSVSKLMLESGSLDLQGQFLTIQGDLIQTGGFFNIGGGTLRVKGDYKIQTPGADGDTYSDGALIMQNEDDLVTVAGDFTMDSTRSHKTLLGAGKLEVGGNFTQLSSYSGDAAKLNFHTTGTHKVVLNGIDTQNVSFEDVNKFNLSYFNELVIENPSYNINMPDITAKRLTYDKEVLTLPSFKLTRMDHTLLRDMTIELPPNESVTVSSAQQLYLDGYTLLIKGNLKLESHLNIQGGNLIVEGNLVQTGGFLNIGGGTLLVKGDYKIQTPEADGDTYSNGMLIMQNEDDLVTVEGDVTMDSARSHKTVLSAGQLEVGGNFTQLSSYSDDAAKLNFHTTGTHKVVLNGIDTQNVSFEDVNNNNLSYFHELVLGSGSRATFTSKLYIAKLFNHQQQSFVLLESSVDSFPDFDGDGIKDHIDAYPTDPLLSSDDRDNDGVKDNIDAFPDDPAESLDTDNDGTGNNADLDDDNDDIPDTWELAYGLDPLDASDATLDSDDDGTSNLAEFLAGTNPQGSYSFDIDGDGTVLPLTDGLLAIRYQFGFRGDSLIMNATSGTAIRISATDIEAYIAEGQIHFDLDGDGEVLPLTDGLLLLRYLFGFRGDGLVANALGADANRTTSDQLEGYLGSLVH